MKYPSLKIVLAVSVFALLVNIGCRRGSTVTPDAQNRGFNASKEDMSNVPLSVNITTYSAGSSTLPSQVDLTKYLPPIGHQGYYGTCVGWGVGYNTLSGVEAIQKGLTTKDLSQPNYQISPKDLFIAIPNDQKGPDCDGTNLSFALDVLVNRGAATLADVPYTDLGNCDIGQSQSKWTTAAKDHKIKSYRRIGGTVNTIKQYLAHNTPIVFGAILHQNFDDWRTDDVYTSASGVEGGGHCMTVVGYDDSKGPGGAFKIANSWGATGWGSNGYIWIDYNFFVNTFVYKEDSNYPVLYIIDGATAPLDTFKTTGNDLSAWVTNDYPVDYTGTRQMIFNIYNMGSNTISASTPWSITLFAYNAYDLNDNRIIFRDSINTTIPFDSVKENGNMITINTNIPPNGNMALSLFGAPAMRQTYTMPALNGNYYLVLVAAPGDPFSETNTMNNIFYTTTEPKSFSNGFSNKTTANASGSGNNSIANYEFVNNTTPTKSTLNVNKYNTAVTPTNRNAYRPDEVTNYIKAQMQSGELEKTFKKYRNTKTESALTGSAKTTR